MITDTDETYQNHTDNCRDLAWLLFTNDSTNDTHSFGQSFPSFPTIPNYTNKQTNNNDLLEKDGGTKNCI